MDCSTMPEAYEHCIELGSMPVVGKTWTVGECICGELLEGCKQLVCAKCRMPPLDPEQVVFEQQDITIEYSAPLECKYTITHHTDNPMGFTRRAISHQIMARFMELCDGEKVMCDVDDVDLCSIYRTEDEYVLGLDWVEFLVHDG